MRYRGKKHHSQMPKGNGKYNRTGRSSYDNMFAPSEPYMMRHVPNSVAERVFGPNTPENTGCCSCLTRKRKHNDKKKQNGGRRKRTVRRR